MNTEVIVLLAEGSSSRSLNSNLHITVTIMRVYDAIRSEMSSSEVKSGNSGAGIMGEIN